YQVTLAVDGHHAVSVQSDDPAAVTAALVWARDTVKQLARLTKEQRIKAAAAQSIAKHALDADPEFATPPTCGIHDVPMVLVQGRKGPFWSCHERSADGSWCTFKPVV
ncbi:MAG TPA: hypothetical protein VKU02_10920, partial [Gemmataceae bacterium]|nr:hypothetical protein [Gemmataceae bacterium]